MQPDRPPITVLALRYERKTELFSAHLVASDPEGQRLAPSLVPPHGDVVSLLTEDQLLTLFEEAAAAASLVAQVRANPDLWYCLHGDSVVLDDQVDRLERAIASGGGRP